MKKERKFEGIWNAERVLYNSFYYADKDGNIPYIEKTDDSSDGVRRQRFYAALRAYGKIREDYLMETSLGYSIGDESHTLLGKNRSPEKMNEFRELLKQNIYHDFYKQFVDGPGFLKSEFELQLFYRKLFKYRIELYKLGMIWSGVLECGRSLGILIEMTHSLYRTQINPVCQIIDRMLILLMGDDYDKTFTEKELFQYGYPDVTDDELYQMSIKEEL